MVYGELLLKPLFSFAGKGIQLIRPRGSWRGSRPAGGGDYLLQQRMDFVPTIETPHGLTQVEIRILYLWPDDGSLAPVLSLVRLGRGKMMGVDHNKNIGVGGRLGGVFPWIPARKVICASETGPVCGSFGPRFCEMLTYAVTLWKTLVL